jgi:hypothetical protein
MALQTTTSLKGEREPTSCRTYWGPNPTRQQGITLRWGNANVSHPIDGQRNGKRQGPSSGGKIDIGTVATWILFVKMPNRLWITQL